MGFGGKMQDGFMRRFEPKLHLGVAKLEEEEEITSFQAMDFGITVFFRMGTCWRN